MKHFTLVSLPKFIFTILLMSSLAQAQATRTWVSGVGDDVNPCSRTAPCKTFAGAISKTAAGGEISVLDPGGYGAVTITKSMTISGDGTLASILHSGTNGINVSAGAGDEVIIRNISFHGGGTGQNGIRFLTGKRLVLENVTFGRYGTSAIQLVPTTASEVAMTDVHMKGGSFAVYMDPEANLKVSINNSSIVGSGIGIYSLDSKVRASISNTVIANNASYGVLIDRGAVSLINNRLFANEVAVQAETNGTIRLTDNDIFDNRTSIGCAAGKIMTDATNVFAGNSGGAPSCGPNAALTIQ
jgi:Right handed beta helix region